MLNSNIPNKFKINNKLLRCKYFVYLLKSTVANKYYIGFTTDIATRIRRHNGELTGGAKKTERHRPWEYVLYVSGFEFEKTALQYEFCLHKEKKIIRDPKIKAIKSKLRGLNRMIYLMKYFIKRERICKTALPNSDINFIVFFKQQKYYDIWKSFKF
jgi:predicted GIY-YIG superfamily endonuclease